MRLPLASEEIVFESPFPPEEVRRRLKERVASRWDEFSSRERLPVGGWVREGACKLYARPPMFMHNSFIRVLALRLEPTATGTRLAGRFRLMTPVLIFMSVWFAGVMFFGVVFTGAALARSGDFAVENPWTYMPLGMMTFGMGLVALGRLMARGAEAKVVEFVRETVSAVVVRGEANSGKAT